VSARDRGRAVLARLVDASIVERFVISLAALALSIVVGAVIVLVAGWSATCSAPATSFGVPLTVFGDPICYDPVGVYVTLFTGAFGNVLARPTNFNVALTLQETSLLVFTGLSVAVAFRSGLFNIGTQGQLVLGALASALTVLGVAPHVPAGIVGAAIAVPVGLLVGGLFGGLYGAIPGALKAYADANEVITTIMFNFVATNLAFVAVSEYFQASGSQVVQTEKIPAFARIQPFGFPSGSGFSLLALALGLALAVGLWLLLERTALGYDLRTTGAQPKAAEYGGVNAERTVITSMFVSGAFGGIGGAVWVLMVMGSYQIGIPSLGFDGITVSILAGNNPLGVPVAALLFGILKSGSLAVEFAGSVPHELAGVLRGLIILFVAMPEFFRLLGRRFSLGEGKPGPAAPTGGESE